MKLFTHGVSVQAKLRWIALLLVLGMAVSAATALVSLWRMQKVNRDVVAQATALSQLQTADMAHDGLRSVVYASFLIGQIENVTADQIRRDQRMHSDAMRESMATLATALLDPALRASFHAIAPLIDSYLGAADDVVTAAVIDRRNAHHALHAFDAVFDKLRLAFDERTESLRAQNVASLAQEDEVSHDAYGLVALTCTLTLALMAAAVHLVGMSIRRSLQAVEATATAVASGDLDRRADVLVSDEVGQLGRSVNAMADKLQTLLGTALADAGRHNFANELNVALEMADSEVAAYQVVRRAMRVVAAERPMELLVSDSSQAVLQRATEHPQAGAPGCGVDSPFSCQAVRRGNTVAFPDSEALDACPRLRDRPGVDGPISAVCVPLHFMGRALGVLHTTGPVNDMLGVQQMAQLGAVGNQAAARIGVVRAFERTQLQAATDAATGLANRRALEASVRELMRKGEPFALVMADLDRFKMLNDTYGHLVGDDALRLFADTVKGSARSNDTVARWGGEEFAIVLAGTMAREACEWADRARGALAAALAGGKVPKFTVSFGIADSTMATRLEDMLRIADEALYLSKEQGRDRATVGAIVAANEAKLRQRSEHVESIDVGQLHAS